MSLVSCGRCRSAPRGWRRRTAVLGLVALVCSTLVVVAGVAVPPGAGAAPTETLSSYTGPGISQPWGIAPGPDGALWFTNSGNSSIGRITLDGVVTNFAGGGISQPWGITAGPDGNLWFTNLGDDSIGRITPAGTVTRFTGTGISAPRVIAAGPDGNLWFTNSGNDSIGRITTGGTVSKFTGTGISQPWGITAGPDDNLWFTNAGNSSIGQITTGGTVKRFTHASIVRPLGIAAGPDGSLWFTNYDQDTVGRITPAGSVVSSFVGLGISDPVGIAAGPDGNLWFTNSGNGSIGRTTPYGDVSNVAGAGIANPAGIVTGPDGALWFTNVANDSIGRITAAGVVSIFPDPSINSPRGITAGPDGNLWFTNYGSSTIGRITPAGVVSSFVAPSISGPSGITAGPDGNLWFTNESGSTIGRITPAGVVSSFTGTGISMPRGITAGPDGNLWFTNFGSSSIGRITPAGVVSRFTSPGSINGPSGITAGPDGNLWFTNLFGYSIGRISPTGSTWTFTGNGVSFPLGIAAGPDGNLWFTNDDSIGRITPGGVVSEFTDQHLDRPAGIAAGADGNLWFANAVGSIGRIVPAAGDAYHPLSAPTRILDSRPPPEQVGVYRAPWGAGESRQVAVAGVGGVPAEATAVTLNVTVTGTTAASFVAIWPLGAPAQPTASNVNWSAGQTIANAVTVKVGDSGKVWVFNNAGAADVIFDVVGWYDQSGAGAGITAQAPVRVLDSRPPPEQVGPYATPWGAGTDRAVAVAGGTTGVPADAEAVVANVTVTDTTAESFLTVYPNGAVRPTASSLNWKAGVTIPNAVTVKVGADGKVRVFNNSGGADVIVDVVGYFAAGSGDLFHPLAPVRFQDSRPGTEQVGAYSTPWSAKTSRTVSVLTGGAVPAGATAVLANVTVTSTSAESFLTLWNTGAVRPTASNLNWKAGVTIANAATAKVGTGDTISVFNNSGTVDVVADAAGWYG